MVLWTSKTDGGIVGSDISFIRMVRAEMLFITITSQGTARYNTEDAFVAIAKPHTIPMRIMLEMLSLSF
jgi:hypothetical protein